VAVGHVHGTAHALLAGAGLALAVTGIGLAVWTTSQVLAPRLTTPATLRSRALEGLRRQLDAEPEQFFGVAATSVNLLPLGHAWAVKAALDRSRWCTLGGGVLVVAGAVLFFIATGNGTR
jgi:hypothetical protein